MKKLKDNELTELTGGMTCKRLGEILSLMMDPKTGNNQTMAQAIALIDLMHSGYTLCYG